MSGARGTGVGSGEGASGGAGGVPFPGIGEFRARCRALGLFTWWCDAAGAVVSEPDEPGEGGRWLRSAPVRGWVERAARQATASRPAERAVIAEPAPGVWAVTLVAATGRRKAGVVVGLGLGPAALDPQAFIGACGAAEIDAPRARGALQSAAGHTREEFGKLGAALRWMMDDMLKAGRDGAALEDFTQQLAEVYEEIGLLYRLGQSMNRLPAPEEFVQTACRELAQTLPFGWVGAKFMDSRLVAQGLSGEMVVAGSPPCDVGRLDELAGRLVAGLKTDRWTLATPAPHPQGEPLARLVGSQVLAHPICRDGKVIGALLAGNKRGPDPEISSFDTQLLDASADYMRVFVENAGLYADQHALFVGTVQAMTAAIDAKDRYTCGHSERVAWMAWSLALACGMDEPAAERVRITGLLHDVGKIGVPEAVLTKPGRLTPAEFDEIKKHPAIGHHILKDIALLQDVLPGVLHHHERWDGRGYPQGLAGDQIPMVARLLAVGDSFDAMSSNRSYRAAMKRGAVLAEIARCAGTQFDPVLAAAFVGLDLAEYDRMVVRHQAMEGAVGQSRAA